jgi:hypothetical protein
MPVTLHVAVLAEPERPVVSLGSLDKYVANVRVHVCLSE